MGDTESPPEVDAETLDGAHEEWDYRHITGQFGTEHSVSFPCQLFFTEDADQDTERFHDALSERGFHDSEPDPDYRRKPPHPYYDGEVVNEDNHTRIGIRVVATGRLRIYPRDDYVPTRDELARLLEAVMIGFDTTLEHSPVEENQ